MIAATILLGRALQPVELLIGGWKAMIEARAAWRRLAARPLPVAQARGWRCRRPKGRLEIERLSYSFSSRRAPLLRGVSLSVFPGESLGIIGPSASGKTTLLRLLLGIRTAQAGTVRLDGADIAQLGSRFTRPCHRLSAAGRGAVRRQHQRQHRAAAEAGRGGGGPCGAAGAGARSHPALPDGYDTEIGDGGSLLSGGQRQRIALARALYGDPRLLVLDEPNANLDDEGDAALAVALTELKARGVTVVIVSHRRGLISRLDRIAVLRNGKIESFGPSSLMLARSTIACIAQERFTKSGRVPSTDAAAGDRMNPSCRIRLPGAARWPCRRTARAAGPARGAGANRHRCRRADAVGLAGADLRRGHRRGAHQGGAGAQDRAAPRRRHRARDQGAQRTDGARRRRAGGHRRRAQRCRAVAARRPIPRRARASRARQRRDHAGARFRHRQRARQRACAAELAPPSTCRANARSSRRAAGRSTSSSRRCNCR